MRNEIASDTAINYSRPDVMPSAPATTLSRPDHIASPAVSSNQALPRDSDLPAISPAMPTRLSDSPPGPLSWCSMTVPAVWWDAVAREKGYHTMVRWTLAAESDAQR